MSAIRSLRLLLPLVLLPSLAPAQAPRPAPDSADITAGAEYRAGALHRFLLGDGYRDLWTTPMHVEVLDLRTFAGGIRADKLGGGFQTRSLRFVSNDGIQFVFRPVDKTDAAITPRLRGTVAETVYRDMLSTSDPGAALVVARLLDAAGVLHVTPILVVMPDDSMLGEFRAAFAGRLGMIEQSPGTPGHRPGFAGAVAIIDSDTLLALLDGDPGERIDAPALLAARLMDMMLGDWDRHQGQWKWARMEASPRSAWEPIPRDRDKAFISYGGMLPGIARLAAPNLMTFGGTYPAVRGLTWNSVEFDRRMLGGLERPVWDSVAARLMVRVTDSVIDDAVLALPLEYMPSAPALARTLKQRRDALPSVTNAFYRMIAAVADIHATDAADRARITRIDDRFVEVRLESGSGTPYFLRRFDALETGEIRVYLHGGADSAVVTGDVQRSIPVRVIGGNGDNRLLDSSRVHGAPGSAHLYGAGLVNGVGYGPDTLFNRRPWVRQGDTLVAPMRDRGAQLGPLAGFRHNRDLGFVALLGASRTRFGFGRRPYANRVSFSAEYASRIGGFRIGVSSDRRAEGSPVHLSAALQMSQLELLNYHGLGNATPDSAGRYFEVRQRQWMLRPAVGLALGPHSDLSLGPVLQYSVTDSTANRFIASARPYGFGRFGQAGLRMILHHDVRDDPLDPHRGILADLTGSVYPALWDVASAFGDVGGRVSAWVTIPMPVHPIAVLTAGGRKVFGAFPVHEAAFIGGRSTLRSLDAQRYAGDASLYGTVELRVPIARFAFILPWNVGVFGIAHAGRVFVDGASPGGWHVARGLGFWVGVLNPTTAIRFCGRPGEGGSC